jgi:hypothetical protein
MPTLTLTPTSGNYEGRYTSEAKVAQFLGQYNIDVYADVDDDGTADTGAVQQAIVTAEGTVDFRTGAGPFTFSDATQPGPVMLEKWSRYLAAVEVAQKRLGTDATAVQSLRTLREEAYAEMDLYRDGTLPLIGATPSPLAVTADAWAGEAPISATPTVDSEGRTITAAPPRGAYFDRNAGYYRWS